MFSSNLVFVADLTYARTGCRSRRTRNMSFEIHAVRGEEGSPLRAVLPVEGTDRYDPFLVLHEQGPVTYRPGRAVGFTDHPHRGFETVNYIIEGEQFHRDSHGNEGIISAGGMQWMTAASGVIHAELPTPRLLNNGGAMHAFQIWLNLPRAMKMAPPRYQEFAARDLPVVEARGAWVRVLAGSYQGIVSPVKTVLPTLIAHVRLQPRADVAFQIQTGATTVVYAMSGSAQLGPQPIQSGQIATSRERDSHVALGAGASHFEALVLSAMPIGEPVVSEGPFVMTTPEEIREAFADYRSGRFAATAAAR
jgi:redox-sensitive bicupin YhaK (pirin superfamily)